MTETHAPDAMGAAAHKCAMLVTRQPERLLLASSPTASRTIRADNLEAFFRVHRAYIRAVAQLELAAPNSAERGYEADAELEHFIVEGKPLP